MRPQRMMLKSYKYVVTRVADDLGSSGRPRRAPLLVVGVFAFSRRVSGESRHNTGRQKAWGSDTHMGVEGGGVVVI